MNFSQDSLSAFSDSEKRTYWFIRLVFPTPLSPRIITYASVLASWVTTTARQARNEGCRVGQIERPPYLEQDLLAGSHSCGGGQWAIWIKQAAKIREMHSSLWRRMGGEVERWSTREVGVTPSEERGESLVTLIPPRRWAGRSAPRANQGRALRYCSISQSHARCCSCSSDKHKRLWLHTQLLAMLYILKINYLGNFPLACRFYFCLDFTGKLRL